MQLRTLTKVLAMALVMSLIAVAVFGCGGGVSQTELDAVKGNVSALESDVSGVKSDLSTAKGDVSAVKADVSSLKSSVVPFRYR